MRFILKAIFFLAVVAAFIPRPSGGDAGGPPAERAEAGPPPAQTNPIDSVPAPAPVDLAAGAEEAAAGFCADKPALCQTARESVTAARLVGGVAVQQARQAMEADAAKPDTSAAPEPENTAAP